VSHGSELRLRVKLLMSQSQALAVPGVEEYMDAREERMDHDWPRWVKHYESTGGFKIPVCIADYSQTPQAGRRGQGELLFFRTIPCHRSFVTAGFLQYRAEREPDSRDWWARKYSLLTDGSCGLIQKTGPFTTRREAMAHGFRWEVTELYSMEYFNPGSYEQIPVPPAKSKGLSERLLACVIHAQRKVLSRLDPQRYVICDYLDRAETDEQYNAISSYLGVDGCVNLLISLSPVHAPPNLPEGFLEELALARRRARYERRGALDTLVLDAELAVGWIRRGYCFLSERDLAFYLNWKLDTRFSIKAIEKRRLAMELYSNRGALPKKITGEYGL
jgi:hypothetical protein